MGAKINVPIVDGMKVERTEYTDRGVDFLVSFDAEDARQFVVVEWVGSKGKDLYTLRDKGKTAEGAWENRGAIGQGIFNCGQWRAWLRDQTATGCE